MLELYKHKHMRDVAVRIVRKYDDGNWLVEYWNIVNVPYNIGLKDKVEIVTPSDWELIAIV